LSKGGIPVLDILSTISVTVLAFLTYYSVRASQGMVREMREVRLAQFKPLLHPRLVAQEGKDREQQALKLVIENIGEGPALDVDLHVRGGFKGSWHTDFLAEGQSLSREVAGRGGNQKQAQVRSEKGGSEKEVGDQVLSGTRVVIKAAYKDLFGNPIKVEVEYAVDQEGDGLRTRLVRTLLEG